MSGPAPHQIDCFEYPAGDEPRIPCSNVLANGDFAAPTGECSAETKQDRTADEQPSGHDFEDGRLAGIEEGRALERQAHAAAQAAVDRQRTQELSGLLARFDAEHDRFFKCAEQQVVRLALAIAERILRHQAELDPLLLTGAVRTALGQLSDSTETRLRVPAADFDLWAETIAHLPHPGLRPTVIPDESMRTGDCVIETSMGTADVGLAAQLGELTRSLTGQPAVEVDGSRQGEVHR